MSHRGGREAVSAVGTMEAHEDFLWVLALLFFGIGDLLITGIGWQLESAVEVGPIAAEALGRFGMIALIVLKLLAFGLCYRLWQGTVKPYSAGIPFALAALGVSVTAWNLAIVGTVIW
jgi:hypothetical protein